MTDDANAFWNDAWLTMQKQYWDAFARMTQHGGAAPNPWAAGTAWSGSPSPGAEGDGRTGATDPWATALDQWWRSMGSFVHPAFQDIYQRLVEQGRTYLQMGEEIARATQRTDGGAEDAWQRAADQVFAQMKQSFQMGASQADGWARHMRALWELPVEHWNRVASSMSILPGDFYQGRNVPGFGGMAGGAAAPTVDQFLSTPGIGHMRVRQEQHQHLMRLALEYQEALQEYMAAMSRLGIQSVEHLQKELNERADKDEPVTSLRGLYDLWVDACEEVYGTYVKTDEYAELHGRLVNKLMALKHHGQMMVDEFQGSMNMPTRQEMDTLQARLQQMRREHRALQVEIKSLRAEFRKGGKAAGNTTNERAADTMDPSAGVESTRATRGKKTTAKKAVTKKKASTAKKRASPGKKKGG